MIRVSHEQIQDTKFAMPHVSALSPVHTVYDAVRRHTHVEVRRRTVPYVHVRQCTATYVTVRRRMTACCVALRRSPYGDAVRVNAAVEITVLGYNVAVRCCTATYGAVRRCTAVSYTHLTLPTILRV